MVAIVRLGITYGVVRLYHICIVQPITFCLDTRMSIIAKHEVKTWPYEDGDHANMSTKVRMRLRAHE
jgi:hypothetical protein